MSSFSARSTANVLVLKNASLVRSCPDQSLQPAEYPRFIVLSTPLRGLELVLRPRRGQLRWYFGSDSGADFTITDSTLHPAHLSVERSGDDWIVSCHRDCWGFFVNDEPVETAVVEHGDRLRVGRHELVFVGSSHVPVATQPRSSSVRHRWLRWFYRAR